MMRKVKQEMRQEAANIRSKMELGSMAIIS